MVPPLCVGACCDRNIWCFTAKTYRMQLCIAGLTSSRTSRGLSQRKGPLRLSERLFTLCEDCNELQHIVAVYHVVCSFPAGGTALYRAALGASPASDLPACQLSIFHYFSGQITCSSAPSRAPGCTGSELVSLELPLGPTQTGSYARQAGLAHLGSVAWLGLTALLDALYAGRVAQDHNRNGGR